MADSLGVVAVQWFCCRDDSVTRAMAEVATRTPHLTTLVNNAGVQRLLDFSAAEPPGAYIASEIGTRVAPKRLFSLVNSGG